MSFVLPHSPHVGKWTEMSTPPIFHTRRKTCNSRVKCFSSKPIACFSTKSRSIRLEIFPARWRDSRSIKPCSHEYQVPTGTEGEAAVKFVQRVGPGRMDRDGGEKLRVRRANGDQIVVRRVERAGRSAPGTASLQTRRRKGGQRTAAFATCTLSILSPASLETRDPAWRRWRVPNFGV